MGAAHCGNYKGDDGVVVSGYDRNNEVTGEKYATVVEQINHPGYDGYKNDVM